MVKNQAFEMQQILALSPGSTAKGEVIFHPLAYQLKKWGMLEYGKS
jgi:hypothetical protein